MRIIGIAIASCLIACSAAAQQAPATPSQCDFKPDGGGFAGSCGAMFGEAPSFALKPGAATGLWRADAHPSAAWIGTMTDSDGKFPVSLEIYAGGRGIMRTEYGWFAVAQFAASPGLRFTLDATGEIKPGTLDRKIIARAAAILSLDSVWNRKDNRVCPPDATQWSIYCAMRKATMEVTGAPDHRRPAMEAVRTIIDARSAGRNYQHRLMDYNNDPTTTLADVQSLFREALAGMDDPAWLARHGFAATQLF
ncbi:MAG TPA: hypothetical protein VGF56_17360 [Rhizomicrobium sp.]|jgi:hypothetical protein